MDNYKTVARSLTIDPNERTRPKNLAADVMSFDKQTQAFDFNITPKDPSQTLDLTNAKVIITLKFEDSTGPHSVIDHGVVTSPTSVSYTVNDELKGFTGYVLLNLSLILTNGQQIDVADFRFHNRQSLPDQESSEIPKFNYAGYQDMVNAAAVQIKKDLLTAGFLGSNFYINDDGHLIFKEGK